MTDNAEVQYQWTIERLDCHTELDGHHNVVFTAHWRCVATFAGSTGTVYGSCGFAAPTDSFTEYADLTLAQVLDWCYANGVDKAACEAACDKQIQEQIAPTVQYPPLPWTVTP